MNDERMSFIYIASNESGNVLYTGVTNHLKRRMFEHKNGTFEGFTKKYRVDRLLYYEVFGDITKAIHREKQIKAGSRMKKVRLISAFNPAWIDLYAKI